jgi:AcrR family transcriptional regulator
MLFREERVARKPAAKRQTYHHGNLRAALVEAAVRLIDTEGADALTLRAAARMAGVTQAAPYRHFADKEALLAAVAEEGFRALSSAMRSALAAADLTSVERFRQSGAAYVAFARSRPAHYRVMFGRGVGDFARHEALHRASEETFGLLVDAIAACQRDGGIREGDPRELAITTWATTHGLVSLWMDGPLDAKTSRSIDDLAETVSRDMFFGLAPRG